MDTLVPVVAKMFEGIETTPASILFFTKYSRIPLSIPDWAVINPVGSTTAALPSDFKDLMMC